GVLGQVPLVQLAVLAGEVDAAGGLIHGGRVDAPLADGVGGARADVARIGRGARDGQHLTHDLQVGVAVVVRVRFGGVGVEEGDLVDAVAELPGGGRGGVGVVVVLHEDEVGRGAGVRGHHAGGHDGRGVVPAEGARRKGGGQVGAEVQQVAAR